MLAYSAFRDKIEQLLQDTGNATFSTAELDYYIGDAFRESARYAPHLVRVPFKIESRTGTATGTTASALVDATEAQFTSADVGKFVYNTTDKTWAQVTAYVSASQLTLSKDIMAAGEGYKIFNIGCASEFQINIGDVDDYLSIRAVEYPVGERRNWTVEGDILTILVDSVDDSDPADTDSEIIVEVTFNKRHKLSQLTDFAGAVNLEAGYAAGATSMILDALQTSGTIEAGQEFTIAGTRLTYTVTADATITTSAATISFFPGLDSAVLNNAVITFIQSTIPDALEGPLADYVAARAVLNKVPKYIGKSSMGDPVNDYLKTWREKQSDAVRALNRLAKNVPYLVYPRSR